MLQNIYKIIPEFSDRFIIADGGIKSSGDCVKALTNAHMVMIGNLFAGSSDAPGQIVKGHDIGLDSKYTYKFYKGSSTHKTRNKEGVEAYVKTKGSYAEILDVLLQGIASGCSYQNAHNLTQLRKDVEFVKITAASLRESYPHDIDYIVK
jgi:IMP dehydrogenase